MTEKILFVDDEPSILKGYQRTLRNHFTIVTAESGKEALEIISGEGGFPVIVTDMNMPEMNGVQLLSAVKDEYPNMVRLMLTGNADQQTAVDAINTADVYQFLNKPCTPEEMIAAVKTALQHHQLLTVEQDLLESTVKGSIQAMVDILSIVSPGIFGHAEIVKRYMLSCAEAVGYENTWELETAGLLARLGAVTLSEAALDKVMKGVPLNEDEKRLYEKSAEIGAKLVEKIPRLEGVSKIIRYQNKGFDGSGLPQDSISGDDIPLGARILCPVMALVTGEAAGLSLEESLSRLKSNSGLYDPEILQVIEQIVGSSSQRAVVEVRVHLLVPNMTIAADVFDSGGRLLIKKGQVVTESMQERLISFGLNQQVGEKISVYEDS